MVYLQGLTVEQDENGNLIVARILAGGTIEKQGLLKRGDVILEVNGERVESPEDLLNEVSRSKDTLQFRIAPGYIYKDTVKTQQVNAIVKYCVYFLLNCFYLCY